MLAANFTEAEIRHAAETLQLHEALAAESPKAYLGTLFWMGNVACDADPSIPRRVLRELGLVDLDRLTREADRLGALKVLLTAGLRVKHDVRFVARFGDRKPTGLELREFIIGNMGRQQ